MKYDEYLECAKKHLKACEVMLKNINPEPNIETNIWLELYYLSGYIMEGLTIYAAYKLNNWPDYYDIQRNFYEPFTRITNLDFYDCRKILDRSTNTTTIFMGRDQATGSRLSVQHHAFQSIIRGNPIQLHSAVFNDVPYFGSGDIDTDVADLIDNWRPDVRYYYPASNQVNVNRDLILRLIDTCDNICKKIMIVV